jgi:hypothetical protein
MIKYLSSKLLVYYLRIIGATKLLDTLLINKDTRIKSYEFEVHISRYYLDLVSDLALRKLVKSTIIYTNK